MKGIEFTVDYTDVDMSFISDMDITIMLANALDNSYEAVEALEKNRRQVKLIITKMSDFLLINISHTYLIANIAHYLPKSVLFLHRTLP